MARGPRKTIEEKIQAKEALLASLQIRMKSEQVELEELYREKRAQRLCELEELLNQTGLKAEEAEAILRAHTKENALKGKEKNGIICA